MSTLKYISKTLFSRYLELEIWEPKRTLKVSPRPCLPSRRVLDPFMIRNRCTEDQMIYIILKIKKSPKKFWWKQSKWSLYVYFFSLFDHLKCLTGCGRQPPRWPLIILNSCLYIVFFHIEFEMVGMTIKESEVTVCDFRGKIIKGIAAFTLIYWIAHSVEIQLPCHENTWAALWRIPRGEELRPSTNSQHQLLNCEWTILEPCWKWTRLEPCWKQSSILDWNLMRPWARIA